MSAFAKTFYFKDIFSDKDDFITYLQVYTSIDTDDTPSLNLVDYLWKYVYNRYCNSNILYDTPSAFKRHFGITVQNHFKQMQRRTEIIKELYELTNDDYTMLNQMISAHIINPNDTVNKPVDELLNKIQRQQGVKSKANKFTSYLLAIEQMLDEYLDDHLMLYEKHFYRVFGMTKNYYQRR